MVQKWCRNGEAATGLPFLAMRSESLGLIPPSSGPALAGLRSGPAKVRLRPIYGERMTSDVDCDFASWCRVLLTDGAVSRFFAALTPAVTQRADATFEDFEVRFLVRSLVRQQCLTASAPRGTVMTPRANCSAQTAPGTMIP